MSSKPRIKSKFTSTWLMMIVVGLLAGFTAWEYRKVLKEEGLDPEQEKRLFTQNPEDVTEISVKAKDENLLLNKQDGNWKMIEPVQDEGDTSAIEAFLYSAMTQKGKIFRAEDEGTVTDWAQYGLEPVESALEIKSPKRSEKLDVSSKNAYDGSFFIRYNGELMLGDRGLAQLVGRPARSFRSRRLWRDPTVTVEGADVTVNHGDIQQVYRIVHKGNEWTIDPPPPFAVDTERVAAFVVRAQQLTPTEVVAENYTPDDLRTYLLTKPSLTVVMHFKKQDGTRGAWTSSVGQDRGDEVYVTASTRPTLYKTPLASVDSLRVPLNYFRDGKRSFKFPVEQARTIETYSGGKLYKFKKDGSKWILEGLETPEPGDAISDRLVNLVQKIGALEAQDFMPASSAKGFKPEQSVVIRDENGAVLLDLSWGEAFRGSRPYNKGMTFRYVKTNLEKEAMAVSSASVEGLLNPPLVKSKPADAKTPPEKAK